MRTGCDHRADLGKVGCHRFAVAAWHDQPRALAGLWTDRAEDVGRLGALVVGRGWPRSALRPTAGDLILLTDPRFILEPQLYFGAGRERPADLVQAGGKVFLKASIACASWA